MTGKSLSLVKRHRLKGLRLDELSLVDKPANEHATVSIIKREQDDAALRDEIAKVRAKATALEEALASTTIKPTTKRTSTMPDWQDPETIAKAVEAGNASAFTVSDVMAALTKLAEQHKRDGESLEQTFSRVTRETEIGKALYNARKDVRDDPAPTPEPEPEPRQKSDAEQELDGLAKRRADETGETFETAYAEEVKTGRGAELFAAMRQG